MVPFDQKQFKKLVHLDVPELEFPDEYTLRIGNTEMAINQASLQSRVFKFFKRHPDGILKREDLLEILHESSLERKVASIQFEGSLWKNGHQVMSRLRRTLCYCFRGKVPVGTEWLPYIDDLEGWIFYKLPGYGADGCWHA